MEKTKRCAIIGGSISGLTSAKWAKQYGIEPVIFEATNHIGGLWLYKEEDGDLPTVMKSTVINSSKECAALSDYPPPAESAPYMHHTKFYDYIVSYAKDNEVTQHVRLNHRVKNAYKTEDYKKTGAWNVEYTDSKGNLHHEVFDAVLSCVGHHTTPNWPKEWPGQQTFQGKFTHAHSYKHPRGYEDKVVVVVGAGNSAMDVICELGRVSKQVHWSTRRGAWISPKCTDNGWPVDMALQRRIFYHLGKYAPSLMEKYIRDKHNRHMDHELYGIRPNHGVFNQHPTASDELPIRIASGLVLPRPDIKCFGENSVEFIDGTIAENVDEVVFATGYRFNFPFLENGQLVPVEDNKCRLYKQMYPQDRDEKNTCAVIGLVQPLGSILPVSEIQARLFFDAFVGNTKLPSCYFMEKANDDYQTFLKENFVNSQRYTIEIDYMAYMNEIGDMLGCSPRPFDYLYSDPSLFYSLMFGAELPYAFRLRGPHKWDGARKAVLEANKRVEMGIRKRSTATPFTYGKDNGIIVFYIIVVLILALLAKTISYIF